MAGLIDVPEQGCGEPRTSRVILGDNLLALHALEATFGGAVRLAYLDPPYNTGNVLPHYLDDREHDQWLEMMRPRLLALRPLLRADGVVVAQIDRGESAYLKVLMDEVFSRRSYVTTIAVRMSGTSGFKIEHTDRTIVKNTEYLHVYCRNLELEEPAHEEALGFDEHYCLLLGPDRASFGRLVHDPAVASAFAAQGLRPTNANLPALHQTSAPFRAFVLEQAARICRSHTAPGPARRALRDGTLLAGVPPGDPAVVGRRYADAPYLLRRTRGGVDQLIPLSLKLRRVDAVGGPDRVVLSNILGDFWDGFHRDMGNVEQEGGVRFKASKKPERLLRRLLRLFTRPGDLVLDPFGGSGTTAAVAQKMGRPWITVEAGPHGVTHLLPRLRRVVEGRDPGGVTPATGWRGGGGFSVSRVESGGGRGDVRRF